MSLLTGNCPGCDAPFSVSHDLITVTHCSECDEKLLIHCDGCSREFVSSQLENGNCEDCAAAQNWTWHFGPRVDGDRSVIVTTAAGDTMLVVDYDTGAGRLAGGARFTHLSGPALDDEMLEELADDMLAHDGSQYVPIAPKHYRRAA